MGFISTAKHVLSAAKLVWKSSKGWCLIWDVITCWYLRPIYEKSHAVYLRCHQPYSFWHPLGDSLEASIETVNMFTKELGREPGIALRTRETVTPPIKMAKLLVRTSGLEGRRQETVIAYNIGHELEKLKLINVPMEDLMDNGETIEPTITDISVELLEICYQGVSHIYEYPPGLCLSPTYTAFLNGIWVRKWGRLYNLDQWVSD